MGINAIVADVLDSLRPMLAPPAGARAATLGAQDVTPAVFRRRGWRGGAPGERPDRQLLASLGYPIGESLEISDRADHFLDLNLPLADDALLARRYDLLLDSGTLEHVFDVKEALFNTASLVRPGGKVVHLNPVQGYCNHGFVLMQPTLYFSFYEANGFALRYCGILEYLDEQQRSARLVPVPADYNNLRFASASDSLVVVVAERLDDRPRSRFEVPMQAFYRRLYEAKAARGGAMLPDALYREIVGDLPGNHRGRLLAEARYLFED
ncbi:MAG: class I SAM-dependent methyltransferase [Burkholderiaceae bacterium]|nr:class I SAM-dependent methyltransferase [Burkholderiaceae bacterium]